MKTLIQILENNNSKLKNAGQNMRKLERVYIEERNNITDECKMTCRRRFFSGRRGGEQKNEFYKRS